MADFYYSFDNSSQERYIPKFKEYDSLLNVASGFDIFYNAKTTTHITEGEDSITILGYVYKLKSGIEAYLSDLLLNFKEERIAEAKKELLGQYTAIIYKGGKIYLFSDFLQTRCIFYSIADKSVCSSFASLGAVPTDEYKAFEFLAMRHCIYPVWLGNTTIDDKIKRLRAFEYLKIDEKTGELSVEGIQVTIDNRKVDSLKEIKALTLSLLRDAIHHPAIQHKKIGSTITGGFDSRFVTSLAKEYYPDLNLRISTFKGEKSLDFTIATEVAKALSLPLKIYETDLEKQKGDFYDLSDGLTPRENSIMMELFQHTTDYDLGFGGAYGTELYTTAEFETKEEWVNAFLDKVKHAVKAPSEYYKRFEQSLYSDLEAVEKHYLLKEHNPKDLMRIFRLLVTGFFSSQVVATYNIHGLQYELFGTYPVIETGLKIPYKYLGSKLTFGRFYMIPKALVATINPKVSKINTTHFCPMCPLSVFSLIPYVSGKLKGKQYYKNLAKTQAGKEERLTYHSDNIQYTSNYWFEGFMLKYLSESKKP
ncbi:asparagine synthase-related protein [Bacteroides sp. 51]|uniref:asparagine synthase-related protein n=1 Tax=Bacteroides sp. 51 TaxID=2302938 RepID=UPI0013D0A534|nr:asparagine synthase-related protein [Bacteroides sp. 51]NDV82692.1 hypothetical protein [Bacteroides sp. 51]